MTKSVDDLVEGDGKPYIKLTRPGSKLVGEMLDARVGIERDYDTGGIVTWDDGTPKDQLVVDVRIDWARSVDVTTGKDGERAEVGTLYCKFLQQKAFAAACKAVDIKMSQVGPLALLRLDDGTPRNPRHKPPQQFAAEVAKRTAAPGVDSMLSEAPAPAAQAAPVAQPAPQTAAPGSLLGG